MSSQRGARHPGRSRTGRRPPPWRLLAAFLAVAVVGACGGDSSDATPPYITVLPTLTSLPNASGPIGSTTTTTIDVSASLVGLCPNPVVVQLDGPIDLWALPIVLLASSEGVSDGFRFRSALLNPYSRRSTGVDIEIRTINTLTAGSSVASVVMSDPSTLLGTLEVRNLLPITDGRPKVIAAPWTSEDLALTWNVASSSSKARTIGDLAGATLDNPDVDETAAAYLRASGLLPSRSDVKIVRPDVSAGTDAIGSVSLFHTLTDPSGARARIDSKGLARAQLLREVGWEPIPHAVVTSPGNAESRADCLRGLVPRIQEATLRMAFDPEGAVAHLGAVSKAMGLGIDEPTTLTQLQGALGLGLLGSGTTAAPIAADVTSARLLQIMRAQATASKVAKPRMTLPERPDVAASDIVDRRFLSSSCSRDWSPSADNAACYS